MRQRTFNDIGSQLDCQLYRDEGETQDFLSIHLAALDVAWEDRVLRPRTASFTIEASNAV